MQCLVLFNESEWRFAKGRTNGSNMLDRITVCRNCIHTTHRHLYTCMVQGPPNQSVIKESHEQQDQCRNSDHRVRGQTRSCLCMAWVRTRKNVLFQREEEEGLQN